MNASGEVVGTTKFHPGQAYQSEPGQLGLDIGGQRSTKLGFNIYASQQVAGSLVEPTAIIAGQKRGTQSISLNKETEGNEGLAKEELNLLAKLIGTETNVRSRETFRLNLFETDTVEEDSLDENNQTEAKRDSTVKIDLKSNRERGEIDKIIKEMTVSVDETEDDDLLSLMDKAH